MTISFNEFCSLLVKTKPEDVIEEEETFMFHSTPVEKKQSFVIQLRNEENVEYTADQLVHFYRTKDFELRAFVATKTVFKKISLAHRAILKETIDQAAAGKATTAGAAPKATTTTTTSVTKQPSVREEFPLAPSVILPPSQSGQTSSASAMDGLAAVPATSTTKRAKPDGLGREICYFDRNVALTTASRGFQDVIEIDRKSKLKEEEKKPSVSSKRTTSGGGGTPALPILVVPSNSNAVLNLYNIKAFLEDCKYQSYDQLVQEYKEKQQPLVKPENVFVTQSKSSLTKDDLRFRVVDTTVGLEEEAFERIVAVFVGDQEWQVKNWSAKWVTPQDIFSQCRAFYVYFGDSKIPLQVKRWNVLPVQITRHSRHKEIARVFELWNHINEFLERNKPKLLQALMEEAEVRLRAERDARNKAMQAAMEVEEEEEEETEMVEAEV